MKKVILVLLTSLSAIFAASSSPEKKSATTRTLGGRGTTGRAIGWVFEPNWKTKGWKFRAGTRRKFGEIRLEASKLGPFTLVSWISVRR